MAWTGKARRARSPGGKGKPGNSAASKGDPWRRSQSADHEDWDPEPWAETSNESHERKIAKRLWQIRNNVEKLVKISTQSQTSSQQSASDVATLKGEITQLKGEITQLKGEIIQKLEESFTSATALTNAAQQAAHAMTEQADAANMQAEAAKAVSEQMEAISAQVATCSHAIHALAVCATTSIQSGDLRQQQARAAAMLFLQQMVQGYV